MIYFMYALFVSLGFYSVSFKVNFNPHVGLYVQMGL